MKALMPAAPIEGVEHVCWPGYETLIFVNVFIFSYIQCFCRFLMNIEDILVYLFMEITMKGKNRNEIGSKVEDSKYDSDFTKIEIHLNKMGFI
jgi:hypothetical protein